MSYADLFPGFYPVPLGVMAAEQPDPGDTIPDEPNDPVPDPEGEPE